MNESTIRKSAIAATVRGLQMWIPMGVLYVAWFAVLMFANLPALALSQLPCPGIHVKIPNIRNSNGSLACALFESPDGFPDEYLHFATNIMVIKVRDKQARCDFLDIPLGTYALVVVHEENMNSKPDLNWLGAQPKATVFQTTQKLCSVRLRFLPPAFPTTGKTWR